MHLILYYRSVVSERDFEPYTIYPRISDSTIGITSDYGLDDRGVDVRVPVGSRIFSSPRRPDRLWGPPNLIPNVYGEALSPG
jgi:hypothetical protein